MIIVFAFIAANIFFAPSKPVAIYKWIKVGEFFLLGLYIVRTKPNLSLIAYLLSLGVLYSSLIAITQFFLQRSIGGLLWFLGERTFTVDTPGIARFESCRLSVVGCWLFLRPYATFSHANVLGGYLATVLPLIIYKSTKRRRNYFLTTLVLGVTALLLTFSRSAWIAGGVAIALAIAKFKVQSSKFKVAIQI